MKPSCWYCSNEARFQIRWLFDALRRPRQSLVPWCGCELKFDRYPLEPMIPKRDVDFVAEPIPVATVASTVPVEHEGG